MVPFIYPALQSTSDSYSSKVNDGSSKQSTLLELAWKLDDLSRLSTDGRKLLVEIVSLKELLTSEITSTNIGKRLSQLYESLQAFVKGIGDMSVQVDFSVTVFQLGLYKHKRTAATHIFVILISTEMRSKKPYALPVQCFSYTGIGIDKMRAVLNRVVSAMVERNMSINGKS